MKKALSLLPIVLLFGMTLTTPRRVAAQQNLTLLTPQGGPYYAGETLEIIWQRKAKLQETVSFSITLLPEGTAWEELSARRIIIAKDVRLNAEAGTAPQGLWRWQIPADIAPGAYRIEIIEGQEHVFATAWDRSDETLVIAPRPKIMFRSLRTPGEIRAGSSPEFHFAMEAWGTNTVQAFLMRGDEVIGQLLGSETHQGEKGSVTGSFTWELTRYVDATGRHFAPPGEGYRVLVGVLTAKGYQHNTGTFINAFASFDETAPFAIVGTPPPLSLQKLQGRAGFGIYIYIVGEPLQKYVVFHSHTIVPARWEKVWTDRTDSDGVLGGGVNLRGLTAGFFRAEQVSTNLK